MDHRTIVSFFTCQLVWVNRYHRLSAVRQANRILVMDKGQIIESGNHQELMQHDGGMYRHLYNLQQG